MTEALAGSLRAHVKTGGACASCGRGAESMKSDGVASRGCLVLYECADGTSAFFHRLCAAALTMIEPKQTLPPLLQRQDVFSPEDRWARQRIWATNNSRETVHASEPEAREVRLK